jgi:hypothetical protein
MERQMAVIVSDQRIAESTSDIVDMRRLVIETSDPSQDELFQYWLEPFLRCVHLGTSADEGNTDLPDWRVVVDRVERSDLRYKTDYGLALSNGTVHVRPSSDPNRIALAVLAVCRAAFKTLAVNAGGLNLHAGCLVSEGRGIAIVGERGAGKTTTLLATLQHNGFSFLANDQIMLANGNTGMPRFWGYPSVLRVRRGSELIVKVPWESALWFEGDIVNPADAQGTGVFMPGVLCAAFGVSVTTEAEAAALVVYNQSDDPGELTVSQVTDDFDGWLVAADLPLRHAYGAELISIIDGMLKMSLTDPPRNPSKVRIPWYRISCGSARVPALANIFHELTR